MTASVEEFLDCIFHATVGATEVILVDQRRQLEFCAPKFANPMSAAMAAALPEYTAEGTWTPTSVQPPPSFVMSQYASNAARGPVPSRSIEYAPLAAEELAVLMARHELGTQVHPTFA